MTKKNILMLLMAVSLAFQPVAMFAVGESALPRASAPENVTVAVEPKKALDSTQQTVEAVTGTEEDTQESLSPLQITIARCAALLVTKNLVRRYVTQKSGDFELGNYVNAVVSFGLDSQLPKAVDNFESPVATFGAKWAEFVAGEVSVVDETKASNPKDPSTYTWNFSAPATKAPWGKMVLKAAARKNLFAPKGTKVRDAFSIPVVAIAACGFEGWKPGATAAEKSSLTDAKFVENLKYGYIAILANHIAQEIVEDLAMSGLLPEQVTDALATEGSAGRDFAISLVGQLVEDTLKTGARANGML